ncbi:MAG: hypothetical protein RB296_10335 [Acidobacteriota bacterium]|jgi:hypothetical protein|nr:hypothetical protein [Acidobacteriota bacterium]
MLRRTGRILFVVIVIVIATWAYLRVVAEPLVRNINHCKREARELRERSRLLGADVAAMSRAERQRLDASREALRKRLNRARSFARDWKRLKAAMRARALNRGLEVIDLRETRLGESERVNLPLSGTRMRRVSARIRGSRRQWGGFLEAVSRMPYYMTLSAVQAGVDREAEMRVDWIWHQLLQDDAAAKVRPELLNLSASILNHPIPPLQSGPARREF